MSLPATDNFNRADETPIGGNWTTVPGQANCDLNGNAIRSAIAGVGAVYWNADTPGNDQYCQGTYPGIGVDPAGFMVRTSTTQLDGYLLYLGGSGTAIIYRMDNGSPTQLTTPNFAYNGTDLLKIDVVGTTITAYKNGVAQASPATDATYASGRAALYLGGAGKLDDFEVGNVGGAAANPPYTPWRQLTPVFTQ